MKFGSVKYFESSIYPLMYYFMDEIENKWRALPGSRYYVNMATNYENGRNDVDILDLTFFFKASARGREKKYLFKKYSYIFFLIEADFEKECVLSGRISLLARFIFYNHEPLSASRDFNPDLP